MLFVIAGSNFSPFDWRPCFEISLTQKLCFFNARLTVPLGFEASPSRPIQKLLSLVVALRNSYGDIVLREL